MGLFSNHREIRKSTAEDPPKSSHKDPPPQAGRVVGGKSDKATTKVEKKRDQVEYVQFIQKSIPGMSPAVLRGMINKHLEMDSTITKQAMLMKIKTQLRQI